MAKPRTYEQGKRAGIKLALKAVPMTWLDPMLTGPKAIIGAPPYHCKDIEALLRAIRARVITSDMEIPK